MIDLGQVPTRFKKEPVCFCGIATLGEPYQFERQFLICFERNSNTFTCRVEDGVYYSWKRDGTWLCMPYPDDAAQIKRMSIVEWWPLIVSTNQMPWGINGFRKLEKSRP